MRTIKLVLGSGLLVLGLPALGARAQEASPRDRPGRQPLEGQVVVDPNNPAYLVYNRDGNGDGRPDPFFLIGPGDPEGFLYLGRRADDGTREGGPQRAILRRLAEHGGNGLYVQVVRSDGGDGRADHNPWRDPDDPASGLDPDILHQWKGWFDEMRDAGIVLFLFLYDDGSHPFDDGCTGTVGEPEHAFIRDLVDALEGYPNLIWVVQEEFKFVGHAGKRRPCDDARIRKAGAIAGLIKRYDDHDHPVGVHHNVGEPMAFPDHPDVDIYVQQADVRPANGRGNLEALHEAGRPGNGFDPRHRFNYIMGEGYNWHPKLVEARDRAMLRKSYYATAMAGGYVTVLGMFPTEEGAEPTDAMLQDMRRLQRFFESTNFNEMAPDDALRHGDTRWVLADPGRRSFLLYTPDGGARLGVKGVHPGRYTLRWFDPEDGAEVVRRGVRASGDVVFEPPPTFGPEVLLHVSSTGDVVPRGGR